MSGHLFCYGSFYINGSGVTKARTLALKGIEDLLTDPEIIRGDL